MEITMGNILPRLGIAKGNFQCIVFRGKQDLMNNLSWQLRAYAPLTSEESENYRILVVVDRDQDDCAQLKARLEVMARQAGLISKSTSSDHTFQILNRIAIEELESWFLGDFEAIHQAYPAVPVDQSQNKRYRDPDRISGGTWEALKRLLEKYHYEFYKVETATRISQFMEPERNQSKSFRVFCSGIRALIESEENHR